MASIIEVSAIVDINTWPATSDSSYSLLFLYGNPKSIKIDETRRSSVGTTVTIQDFLYNMPVRRKLIRESVDIESIRNKIETIALIHSGISFSLRNDRTGSKMIQVHRNQSMLSRFADLYGSDVAEGLVEVHHSLDQFEFSGYISNQPHITKALQFLYVNKRLVLKTKIHKFLNYLLSRSSIVSNRLHPASIMKCKGPNKASSSPPKNLPLYGIFIINIECPRKEYDICLDPAKTLIEFRLWDRVLQGIEELVLRFAEEENVVISLDGRFQKSEHNEAKVKNLLTDEVSVENTWEAFRVDDLEKQNNVNKKYGRSVCTRSLHASVHSIPIKRLQFCDSTNEEKIENVIDSNNYDDETLMNNEENEKENEGDTMEEKTSLIKNTQEAEGSLDVLQFCTKIETVLIQGNPDEVVNERGTIKARAENVDKEVVSIMNDNKNSNPLPCFAEEPLISSVEEDASVVTKPLPSPVEEDASVVTEPSSSLSEFKKFYHEEKDHLISAFSETPICDNATSQKSPPSRVPGIVSSRPDVQFHTKNVRPGKSISSTLGQSFKKYKKLKMGLKGLQKFELTKLQDSKLTEFSSVACADIPDSKNEIEENQFIEKVKDYTVKDNSSLNINEITDQNKFVKSFKKNNSVSAIDQSDSGSDLHDDLLTCSDNHSVVRCSMYPSTDYLHIFEGDRQYLSNNKGKLQSNISGVNVDYKRKNDIDPHISYSSCSQSIEQSGIHRGISRDDQRESTSLLNDDSELNAKKENAIADDCTNTRIQGNLVIPKTIMNLNGNMFSVNKIKQYLVSKSRDQQHRKKSNFQIDMHSSTVINDIQIRESENILKLLDQKTIDFFYKSYPSINDFHCLVYLHRFLTKKSLEIRTNIGIIYQSPEGCLLKENSHNMNLISYCFDPSVHENCAETVPKNIKTSIVRKGKWTSSNHQQLCLGKRRNVDGTLHEKNSFGYIGDDSIANCWSAGCKSLHMFLKRMKYQLDSCDNSILIGENSCYSPSLVKESSKSLFTQNGIVLNSSNMEVECLKSENCDTESLQIWQEAKDDTGRNVYINPQTGNSAFYPPYHGDSSPSNSNQPFEAPLLENPTSSKLWRSIKDQEHFILSHNFFQLMTSEGRRDPSVCDTLEKVSVSSISKQNQMQKSIAPNIQETMKSITEDNSQDSLTSFFEENLQDHATKWRDKECLAVPKKSSQISHLCQLWENPDFEMEPSIFGMEANMLENEKNGSSVQVYNLVHQYKFTKEMLSSCEVIGQLDKKFIVCRINYDGKRTESIEKGQDVIIVFDQHAVHERIRLEKITEENHTTLPSGRRVIRSAISSPAIELTIQKDEVQIMSAFQTVFQDIGIHFEEKSPTKVLINAMPNCLVAREASELRHKRCQTVTAIVESLIREVCYTLKQTKGTAPIMPRVLSSVLNSQACRGAIKFGDAMSLEECRKLISELEQCQLPFQCAHGRPAVVPLVELTYLSTISKKVKKPDLKRISKGLKRPKLND
ncbi:DNA mismatch repair protein Mlh3-like isoform X2 [Oratosquilla oratoria]